MGRAGFTRLVKAVAQGAVGSIFALEVSRLARSSEDWRHLLALCAVAQTLVLDEQSVYDPALPSDRLLLDLKGTMSEAELHWLGLRLTGARVAKARRGALRISAPTGYVWTEPGLAFDPDESVQSAIAALFARYAVSPSGWAVVRWARANTFQVPTRHTHADGTSEVTWKPLGMSRLHEMLASPIYAGAYAYGRRPSASVLLDGQIKRVRASGRDPSAWHVLLRDAHPGLHLLGAVRSQPGAPPRQLRAPRQGRSGRASRGAGRSSSGSRCAGAAGAACGSPTRPRGRCTGATSASARRTPGRATAGRFPGARSTAP